MPALALLAVSLLAAGTADAGPPKPPFAWVVPAGWRTETIPFPLDFAPEVKHRGLEELRFPPGMFKPDAPDFWSYAFVWWLEGETALSAEALERELTDYFRGLSAVVGKKYSFESSRFKCRLKAGEGAITGTIDTYDAFKTGKPITLHVRITSKTCGQHTAVQAAFSPKEPSAPIWSDLLDLLATFACPRADPK